MVDAASAACTVVGLGGIALASCLPTIDLNAVVCAFGGALLFILWAKDITLWQRMGYLLAGWIGGYYGSAEILAQAWTKTSGIAAFSCGLATVLVSISVLESITTGKLPKWVTELPAAIGSLFPKRGANDLDQTITLAHAGFCGGICFVIAFMYRRGGSSYKFLPSLCAFCLASLFGQEWLSIVGAILLYGQWPATSVPST
ncbi:putative holin [Pseudomonas asiatica]|uniref:putative holin n=1 Tax=Pseudomonas asiatica TaxID=2219225 RepID=UPI0010C03215|nr:putative holin [Pseudomonas asiatica]